MESTLEGTVNYMLFVYCNLDAAKPNESHEIPHQSSKRKSNYAYLNIKTKKINL